MKIVGDIYFPDSEQHFTELGDNVGSYQKPQREKALEYVTEWKLCLDIGANVGIFSRHFAQHFEEVWAIEPVSENIACLRKNVPKNVRIIEYAAGEENRVASICRTPKNVGGAFICDDEEVMPLFIPKNRDLVEDINMITIDSLDIENLGLIKIDIQGSEVIALKGAKDTLLRCKPVLLIEEKPVGGKDGSIEHIEKAQKFLLDIGMKAKEKIGADRVYVF
ncbi:MULTISPECIES: FkbM family methyltransferase [unclassified Sphingobium]|uniref:FkbM family methyltransferase n=1 Tax=unclassified Sphingobium TaxID=2611147 RepID=UPI002224453E|nr:MULTISPECIES: FkbM family methyltransferase [unclassified Sphingobium]MCW2411743.1 FkbM family methyltransferase [Sphingobium sp. B8D3D]MCW2415962.1 FkbM family methyltransferase [Sphingobium sp. B8D3A]